MRLSRRNFFKLAGASALGVSMVSPLEAFYNRVANGEVTRGNGYGALTPKLPNNAQELKGVVFDGLDLSITPSLALPPGFKYNVISYTGQKMSDGTRVPGMHDGMAAFSGKNNTVIIVRNHELPATANGVIASPVYDEIGGGTTTLVINSNRQVERHFASLAGTIRNCAGGSTPWGSWVSCEETFNIGSPGVKRHGYNFEVPATADIKVANPIPLKEMGRFNHEAIAVDPKTGYVYQTEDRQDSCFYRFRPNQYGNLRSGGVLEALVIQGANQDTRRNYRRYKNQPLSVKWVKIDDFDPIHDTVRNEARRKGAAIFARGEGAWYGNGLVYFVSTNGGDARQGQVFAYNPRNNTVTLVVESTRARDLNNPDNVTVSPFGDIFLCEDGSGVEYVQGVNRKGEIYQFAANAFKDGSSEFAGVCFSPDGSTMFVNIQVPGLTLAIWGPWRG
jgi:secreted PhoX family phosphatase